MYFLLRLTDNIQVATWLQPDEKAVLVAQLAADNASKPAGTFKTAFQDWRVWVACLMYFCCASGLYGLGFWLPTIVADMGVKSTLEIGMLTAIPYGVAAWAWCSWGAARIDTWSGAGTLRCPPRWVDWGWC